MADSSVLGAAGTGAATGAMVGGPWGALAGAGIGATAALIGGALGVGSTQREPGRYEVDPNAYNFIGGQAAGAEGYQGQTLSREDIYNRAFAQYQLKQLQQKQQELVNDYASHRGLDPSHPENWGPADKQQLNAMMGSYDRNITQDMQKYQAMLAQINQREQALQMPNYIGSIDYSGNQAVGRLGGLEGQMLGQAQNAPGALNQAYSQFQGGVAGTDQMLLQAAQGQVPSVAQIQAQNQMSQANMNAAGLAASAQTPAARALAARAAVQQFGQNAAASSQQQALLRAQEMEAARGQLLGYRTNTAQQQLDYAKQMYGYGLSAAELQERARQQSIAQGMQARAMVQGAQQSRQELQNAAYQGQAGLSYQTGVQKAEAGKNLFMSGVGATQAGLQYGAMAMQQKPSGGA